MTVLCYNGDTKKILKGAVLMPENMGKKINELRTSLDMTLTELGDKVGVGASTVRKWETGMIKNIQSDKIQSLAEALKVTPAYLMGWAVEESDPQKKHIRSIARAKNDNVALTTEEEEKVSEYIQFLLSQRDEAKKEDE